MTCHNRRDKTLACLAALHACTLPSNYHLTVYLVDDGSSDGTSESVMADYPGVILLRANGDLYWNGGMRLAFAQAISHGYDYYLWLNDDTLLFSDALLRLFNCADNQSRQCFGRADIVVGATCDAVSGELTYGGLISRSWWRPHNYVRAPVSLLVQSCKTQNGNCVLIPAAVANVVGNLDVAFIHALGDWDYGFRARRAGFSIWLAPGFIGTCSLNKPVQDSPTVAKSIKYQLKRLLSPKGLPPKAWLTFVSRHYGVFWPVYLFRPYFTVVIRTALLKLRSI